MSTAGDGAVAAGGAEDGDRLTSVGVVLGAGALGFLGTQLWGVLLIGLLGWQPPLSDFQSIVLSPPVGGLGMLTGALLYLQLSDRDLSFLDLQAPRLRDVGYVLGGIVGLLVALQLISILFAQLQVSTAEHGTASAIEGADATVVAYLVVAAFVFIGPGEELLFRNVVQKRLYDSFSRYGAIAVASVVFAIVHFQAYSTGTLSEALASLTVVFALSLLLGWIYHRTESVLVPALVHGAYDAIVFASVYLGAS